MSDPVERAAVIDALSWCNEWGVMGFTFIDKDDAIRQIKTVPSTQTKPTFEQIKEYCDRRCLTIIANEFYYDLITTYSAQPERKNGRWLMGKCSLCGGDAPYYPMSSGYYTSDFCPNCGADMRGGEDEVN